MSKDNSNPKYKASEGEILEALDEFLERFLNPAFGSLSKTEIEILILDLLEKTGKITEEKNSSQYLLSTELKVSPSKAKNLWYNWSLRKKYEEKQLKEMLGNILLNSKYKAHKDNDGWFWLQIENPLLLEYVKDKIQTFGHIQDSSFSPKIIKLQAKAFTDLIEDCIGKEKNAIIKKLGITENKFKGLLIETAKEIAKKHLTNSGVTLVETVFTLLKSKLTEKK